MQQRALVMDDQPGSMKLYWDALEDEGFEVRRCDTSAELLLWAGSGHYHLIVLDRMAPPGEPLGGSDSDLSLNTGEILYRNIRNRKHLWKVPVIMLTAYPENFPTFDDERLAVIDKHGVPQFVGKALEMVAKYPPSLVYQEIEVPDDEHPNVAPYYLKDRAGNDVQVYFERARVGDASVLEQGRSWVFYDLFNHCLSSSELCSDVLKLVRIGDSRGKVAGLYYSPRGLGDDQWQHGPSFEEAPWNKCDYPDRDLFGVAYVMIARHLREWLFRNGALESEVVLGKASFDDLGVAIEPARCNLYYFEHIGATKRPTTGIHFVSKRQSETLLNKVTRRSRLGGS